MTADLLALLSDAANLPPWSAAQAWVLPPDGLFGCLGVTPRMLARWVGAANGGEERR